MKTVVLSALLSCASFAQDANLSDTVTSSTTVRFVDLLDGMTDLDRLFVPPLKGARSYQFSSYDRRSDKGPGNADDWYANEDAGNFLRVETRNNRKEYVLADAQGPGAVVRIWAASPWGTLRFYIDGATEPTWTIGFRELCGGKVAPLLEPICGLRSYGWNCYLPIPFEKSLVLTCDSGTRYFYHVNIKQLAPNTSVESFSPELLVRHEARIEATGRKLREGPQIRTDHRKTVRGVRLRSGNDLRLFSSKTPALVRELRLRIDTGQEQPACDVLRSLRLVVVNDMEELINAPVADFFASAPELRTHNGYPIGVRPDGWAYCRLPMPLPGDSCITLVADRLAAPYTTTIDSIVSYDDRRFSEDPLLLRASWRQSRDLKTRPFAPYTVLDATGQGRYIGCALQITNTTNVWWGEGDEKIWIDGETFPSTFGTGTEDYFGYAWSWFETFSSPFHAQTQCDGPINFGITSLHRFHMNDAIPFQKSMHFDFEVWHRSSLPFRIDYATTAFWYGAKGARSGLPAMPPARERLVRKVSPLPPKRVADAIEGEWIPHTATHGNTFIPSTAIFAEQWSWDMHLWWTGGGPGSELTLRVPIEKAGRYRLKIVLTKAEYHGIVVASLNQHQLGDRIDLYSFETRPTGEIDFGVFDLAKGTQQLVFRIVGKNPKASQTWFGIDYVRFIPQ